MRADTPTKLSLWDFARIIGFNPLHFGGIELQEIAGAYCNRPMPQYEWQDGDRVGREAVARAIAMAEENMEAYLRFHVLPAYDVLERVDGVQNYQAWLRGNASRVFPLNWGYINEGGVRATTLIDAAGTIVWTDAGYWQVGTVTAALPEADMDTCEIRIYYPGHAADPAWEIRPAEVTIAGQVATIVFRRELAVNPDLWDALEYEAANGDDNADFLTDVAVYRVYTDPSQGMSWLWEPWGLCGCGGVGCATCQLASQTGCFYVRDEKYGTVVGRPGTWTEGVFAAHDFSHGFRKPDFGVFSYLSGYRDQTQTCPNKTMYPTLARAVAYYAAALLERPPCDCTVDSWHYWREDATDVSQGRRSAPQLGANIGNPLGTRRGEIYAWNTVMTLTIGQGAVPITV